MKNVFLDTNILIDYVLNRPGGKDAEQLLMHGRKGDVSLSASLLTIANMAYILKGKIDKVTQFQEWCDVLLFWCATDSCEWLNC